MKTYRGITIVSEKTQNRLDEQELLLYESEQKKLVNWLLDKGKDPENEVGYSKSTVETAIYRIDRFYRDIWGHYTDGFTIVIDQEDAERYLQNFALRDYENSYKKGIEKALKLLFKWKHHEHGENEWNLGWSFETASNDPREDSLSKAELAALRGAALEYDDIPSYANVSPKERNQWKKHLSERFNKPENEITKDDWKRANGWKVPSLIWSTLDTGLRPNEVEQATISWVNLDDGVMEIPKENDSTNCWVVGLRSQTVLGLENWLEERNQYDAYSDSDKLWLTRQGTSYQSDSLNYLLKQLCKIAEIRIQDRNITWMTLRQSLGVHLAEKGNLSHIQKQLRYESVQSATRYDSSLEKRKDMLEQIY